MTETARERQVFTAYETREVTVERRYADYCRVGYESFGWECCEYLLRADMGDAVTMRLRRDRRIMNRMELTRLQRQFEAGVRELCILEGSKTGWATAAALFCGVVGSLAMSASVFSAIADRPMIWLSMLAAVPAIAGWALALPVYRRVLRLRTAEVEPLIEAKKDEILGLFEKGDRLRNG